MSVSDIKMEQVKILWVQDEYEGPMSGLAEYNGEKVWFSRINTPSIISSTDVPVPDVESATNSRIYYLHRLSPEDLDKLTDIHIDYCSQMGSPLNHGDPMTIVRKPQSVRMDTTTAKSLVPDGKDVIEATHRSLGSVKHYNHKIAIGDINAVFLTMIPESAFVNYLVPRQIVMV
jgi:hypothetical protein